jgi:hypothetical protein
MGTDSRLGDNCHQVAAAAPLGARVVLRIIDSFLPFFHPHHAAAKQHGPAADKTNAFVRIKL